MFSPTPCFSPALGSRTNSTASKRTLGSSCRSDGSGAQPVLRVTSCHRPPPSLATTSRRELSPRQDAPPCGGSSRRRRCRSAEISPPGRRPSPGPDSRPLLWAEGCSVCTGGRGSTPGPEPQKPQHYQPEPGPGLESKPTLA